MVLSGLSIAQCNQTDVRDIEFVRVGHKYCDYIVLAVCGDHCLLEAVVEEVADDETDGASCGDLHNELDGVRYVGGLACDARSLESIEWCA